MGDHCGPLMGPNSSQCGVQRTGLWYSQGCLARSLYGSRWGTEIQLCLWKFLKKNKQQNTHLIYFPESAAACVFECAYRAYSREDREHFAYLLLISDTTPVCPDWSDNVWACVFVCLCMLAHEAANLLAAISPAVIVWVLSRRCQLLKHHASVHTWTPAHKMWHYCCGLHWHLVTEAMDKSCWHQARFSLTHWMMWSLQISSFSGTQVQSVSSCTSGVPTLTNGFPMPRVWSLIMLIKMKWGMTVC